MRRKASPGRSLRILYCDDEQGFIEEFAARHQGHYEVIGETDLDQVVNVVDRGRRPDLVLLDLFHPRETSSPESRAEMEDALEQIALAEENLRSAVGRNSTPRAIDTLKRLRLRYPAHKLPILVYSRRGLILLEDDQIRQIGDAQAGWTLKDGERIEPETERGYIERFVSRERLSGVVPRDISVATIFLILGLLLGTLVKTAGL